MLLSASKYPVVGYLVLAGGIYISNNFAKVQIFEHGEVTYGPFILLNRTKHFL